MATCVRKEVPTSVLADLSLVTQNFTFLVSPLSHNRELSKNGTLAICTFHFPSFCPRDNSVGLLMSSSRVSRGSCEFASEWSQCHSGATKDWVWK